MQALVIDDSRAMRRLLANTLRELHFDVVDAEHGRAGLERLAQMPKPDLILVDWNMPEMNGLEFVTALRANKDYADIRILMVTTECDQSRMVEALTAGVDEYLMKPFARSDLMAKLGLIGIRYQPTAPQP